MSSILTRCLKNWRTDQFLPSNPWYHPPFIFLDVSKILPKFFSILCFSCWRGWNSINLLIVFCFLMINYKSFTTSQADVHQRWYLRMHQQGQFLPLFQIPSLYPPVNLYSLRLTNSQSFKEIFLGQVNISF